MGMSFSTLYSTHLLQWPLVDEMNRKRTRRRILDLPTVKHGFWGVLQVIVLLECPMTSKLPLLHRWVDILGCNIFVPDGIHDAFNMLEIPSSSRSKAPPQHHWPSSMFHSRQSILLVRFTSYSSRLQDVIVANGCCTKS